MHTVELLAEALGAAKRLGYQVRVEPLDAGNGGVCEFGGKKFLFLDAAQPPLEHLHAVLELLRSEARRRTLRISPALQRLLEPRRAA